MKKIFGRMMVVVPAIFLQLVWYLLLLGALNSLFGGNLGKFLNGLFYVLAFIFVLQLIYRRDESSYKILWIVVIMAMPIFGAMLYFFLGNKNTGRRLKKRLQVSAKKLVPDTPESASTIRKIKEADLRFGQSVAHITETTGFPVFLGESTRYYPFGEEMFRDMCEDLKKAEKYIYVEYFIIQTGKFWDTLVDIMAERAKEGVDVRVIYDDLGSIATYSTADIVKLRLKGIKCISFNPFLFFRSQLNNRDHRKIMVIDGKIAFSGGINLADEYINAVEKFGCWKDIGFRITGLGVMSYVYMFVEFWNAFSMEKIEPQSFQDTLEAVEKEQLAVKNVEKDQVPVNGYVLPYYDSPIRQEHTSNVFYTELLSMATDYVWFYTPYLILGDELFNALIRAAKRGVDVRIIMPGIPDKKMVYRLSRSYYQDLVEAGVKVYEYQPGFVHAKACLSDDKVAAIGTVNLDYRSLFLHFECNCIFYQSDIIKDLKADFEKTQTECTPRTADTLKNNFIYRFITSILRVLAPLL